MLDSQPDLYYTNLSTHWQTITGLSLTEYSPANIQAKWDNPILEREPSELLLSTTELSEQARLKAEAEAAIEELLAKRKAPAAASLADIEQVVRSASLKFEQALTAELLAEGAAELPAWPDCPQCGHGQMVCIESFLPGAQPRGPPPLSS